ncbi:MAG: type II toxin-antitoxin system HicB family antitoxin [Xanthobacteraceae bacterium]|jgi:antitoxin HicB
MRTFTYAAEFEPGDRRGVIVVSFPDVPEAITQGDDLADARIQAEEALGLALLSYPERGLSLPKPRAKGKGLTMVAVAPEVAAKLALLEAFSAAAITKTEFAKRLGKDEKVVRRLLDPKHETKMAPLTAALLVLGKRLVVGIEEAA